MQGTLGKKFSLVIPHARAGLLHDSVFFEILILLVSRPFLYSVRNPNILDPVELSTCSQCPNEKTFASVYSGKVMLGLFSSGLLSYLSIPDGSLGLLTSPVFSPVPFIF